MTLGFPLALLGLITLLVPLAIHLLQRGHHDTVEIATTRFVPVEERPQWRWSRLREPWLWLVRSLLLLAAVILLAEPFATLRSPTSEKNSVTLISPLVDAATAQALAGNNTTLRWLAPGLPSLEEPQPAWQPGQLWGQLWHADQTLRAAQRLRVIAPSFSGELGINRPTLGREVEWIDAPGVLAPATPPTMLTIVHDASRVADAKQMLMVVRAWQAAGLPVQVRSVDPAGVSPQTANVLWLSDEPWSQWLAMNTPGVIVTDTTQTQRPGRVLQRDERGRPAVIEAVDGARTVRHFEYALRSDNPAVTAPAFALTLAQVALPALATPPAALPVSAQTLRPHIGAVDAPDHRRSLDRTWIMIVFVLAVLERAVAAMPARGIDA